MALPAVRAWADWYRFARVVLGYSHSQAAAYADLQFTADMKSRAVGDGADSR
jgi:hypothetical protein